MRPVLIYIWLFTTLLPTFSQWGTIAYYQLNKAYITRVLCENRTKPQLNCNGKCYLAKKLKDQQKHQDEQTSDWVQNIPALQLFLSHLAPFEFSAPAFTLNSKARFAYRLPSYQAPFFKLVPPPCV